MTDCFADLEYRGIVHQISDPDLPKRLDKDHVTVYAGFDPSADSLHLGHLFGLLNLRRLQEAGHRPIVLAGGATGVVGDPTGRAEDRGVLSPEQLSANLVGIGRQLEQFLDFSTGPSQAVLVDNSSWLARAGLLEFLRDVGQHFTVSQMAAKESVRGRLARREHGLSYTEFSYMLLQAYDFRQLYDDFGCKLQAGGSDQWGNITMGIDLIGRTRRTEVWGLTWPLVVKADGTKFGKTDTGTIWLDPRRTSPYQLYQYLIRTEDELVGRYLRYFTWLEHGRIAELDGAVAAAPEMREAQRELARSVTALVHGEGEANRAERAASALFGEEIATLDEDALLDAFADAPSSVLGRHLLDGEGLGLVELLVSSGLVSSKGGARRAIAQGGAYVNNSRQTDTDRRLGPSDLLRGRYIVLGRGRHEHHLVRFE